MCPKTVKRKLSALKGFVSSQCCRFGRCDVGLCAPCRGNGALEHAVAHPAQRARASPPARQMQKSTQKRLPGLAAKTRQSGRCAVRACSRRPSRQPHCCKGASTPHGNRRGRRGSPRKSGVALRKFPTGKCTVKWYIPIHGTKKKERGAGVTAMSQIRYCFGILVA